MNDRIPGSSYDNPIWYRERWRIYISDHDFDERINFQFVHDDFDGAEDSGDHRCGYGDTEQSCKEQIDALCE